MHDMVLCFWYYFWFIIIHLKKFWIKHIGNIGIPYVFWMGVSLFITMWLFHRADFTWNNWFTTWLNDVLYAKQFYLYYLYVTMQFYLVFPLLVWLFKKTEGHNNTVLAISAAIQMIMLFYVK
ncbi:hypothetical protein [Lactobacillus amylolyticus]|uniref:hypothetical protein n=1 Tax=Lactobacillus amylolyticus TaxID=83683 RepID=UPI000FCA8D45|nr:hypothetical protein [Lactobacillus amylolyticus]